MAGDIFCRHVHFGFVVLRHQPDFVAWVRELPDLGVGLVGFAEDHTGVLELLFGFELGLRDLLQVLAEELTLEILVENVYLEFLFLYL